MSIHEAAKAGNVAQVKLNLDSGVGVDTANADGATPLHLASQACASDVVELLLANGASVTAKDKNGATPIDYVPRGYVPANDNWKVINLLVSNGARPDALTGQTLVYQAVAGYQGDIAKSLVEKGIADPTDALVAEVGYGRYEKDLTLFLLEKGAQVNAKDKSGRTLLHVVMTIGDQDVAGILLQKGVDANAPDAAGVTPLHIAANATEDVDGLYTAEILSAIRQGVFREYVSSSVPRARVLALAGLLVASGADVKARTAAGVTPLHIASARGDEDLGAFLVSKGADVKAADSRGVTPLHFAAASGAAGLADLLIAGGADVNPVTPVAEPSETSAATRDRGVAAASSPRYYPINVDEFVKSQLESKRQHGRLGITTILTVSDAGCPSYPGTPLHMAAATGSAETVELLLSKGAKPDTKNPTGETPLHLAAQQGNAAVVGKLLESGADAAARDPAGNTPLLRTSDSDVAQALLSRGASVNEANSQGMTLLHAAVRYPKLLEFLLARGAAVNAADGKRRTPLFGAVEIANPDVVAALLAAGANINAADAAGLTPLHCAVRGTSTRMVSMLLAAGAGLNAADGSGRTPLHLAADKVSMVKVLLEAGANVNARDQSGATPLHYVAEKGTSATAEMLLQKGPDVNAQDVFGATPLHWAAKAGNASTIQVLLQRGAAVNSRDIENLTPLSCAEKNGKTEAAELLRSKGGVW